MREYIDYEFSPVKVSSNGAEMGKKCECVKSLCKNDQKKYTSECYSSVLFLFPPGQDFF